MAVHDNPRYATVQKFVILKSHLSGQALQCIKGIPVTEACYSTAVDALKERFCKTERVKEEIIKQLLSMPGVSDSLAAIRSFADHLTSHIRTLAAMGVQTESFSSLLLPVAKDKLPEAWRLQWARQRSSSANLDEFLTFLRTELNIREEASAGQERKQTPERQQVVPTVSALSVSNRHPVQSRDWMCAACRKHKHGLGKCFVYQRMTPQERWSVVKQSGLCFQCLGPHHVRECQSSNCQTCHLPHHSSLHLTHHDSVPPTRAVSRTGGDPAPVGVQSHPQRSEAPRPHVSTGATGSWRPERRQQCSTAVESDHVSGGSVPIFYNQTVLVNAVGPRGTKQVRVMIDGGSDSSFIRSTVADELGLVTLGQGTFECIAFQEHIEEARTYDQT